MIQRSRHSASGGGMQSLAESLSGIRRRFLMVVIVVGLVWALGISIVAHLGAPGFDSIPERPHVAFIVISLAIWLGLWAWPQAFPPLGACYCLLAFSHASWTQFAGPDDPLRALLFFPVVGAVFLVLNVWVAWAGVALACIIFWVAVAGGQYDLLPLPASTFVITLIITGVFFHAFNQQAARALALLAGQNATLAVVAERDSLTGLLNRRAFQERLLAFLAHVPQKTPLCALFIDVDDFKAINDRYGHAAGDAVLVAVAGALATEVRESDILARIGGEEFAFLLPATSLPDALQAADRLLHAVRGLTVESGNQLLAVTVSVGVAERGPECATADALLQAADAAMYRAKRAGRNCVVVACEAEG
ncbi:MAG: GGDEF domain-containing protein [Pigmentiphaga sp.]|nr:GGDEF domain-containing protein [Pigmentiphaga sp.]